MKKILTIIIATVLVAGSGAFYGGIKYAQNKSATARQVRFGQMGQPTGTAFAGGAGNSNRGAGNGGFVSGEIISKDEKSITVKLQDGGSKIIFFSSGTKISQNTEGSLDDLKVGNSISANGTANQDGSVSAQLIQIRPAIEIK